MKIRAIPVSSRILISTLMTVIVLLAVLLVHLDLTSRQQEQSRRLDERVHIQRLGLSLQHSYFRQEDDAILLQRKHELLQSLRHLADQEIYRENTFVLEEASRIQNLLEKFDAALRQQKRAQAGTELILLNQALMDWDGTMDALYREEDQKRKAVLVFSLLTALLVLLIPQIFFTQNLKRSLRHLKTFSDRLRRGALPPPLKMEQNEFGAIAADLNSFRSELQNKIRLIGNMSEEGPGEIFHPSEEDALGRALLVLSDYLTRKELDEITRNREDKRRNWISEGVAQIAEVLRQERDNLSELSFQIVQKLVTYMNLEMGSLFMADHTDPDRPKLKLLTSYAYDRRKYERMELDWGSGLPGTCAQEKERIFISDVPDDYFHVSSGLGHAKPNCILLVPLKMAEKVFGVLELATVRLLKPFEIEFVESLSESIASSLQAVASSEHTSILLKQSQEQAQILQDQERAMRENMEKLEEAQENYNQKEREFSGILHAINQSTLVAELNPNGRFTSINDRFLELLESPREQVLGKLYSEFAEVDPHESDYKQFWSDLKNGVGKRSTERYKTLSGKDLWLSQSFTPIMNKEGKVWKILNIASDITQMRELEQSLELQKTEIALSNLDMQTLKDAVDSSLIKCELDAKGIILDINEKYQEISGYSRKELLGRNYRLFLKDREKEQFEKIWQEIGKDKVYEGVLRHVRPTGEESWLVSTFSPVQDADGQIYKVYYLALDITERRLKYQLLEEANREIDRLKGKLKENEDEPG